MNKPNKILFVLLFTIFIVACQEKIAVYSGIVKYGNGEPVNNASVFVLKNGKKILTTNDSIGIKDVKFNDRITMMDEIVTDTNGYFSIGLMESYFLFEPKMQLLIIKSGYKEKIVNIKWTADIDNEIYLEKDHCDE